MRTYLVEGKTICVPGEVLDREDTGLGNPIYFATTGYVEGEDPEQHTWELCWENEGIISVVEPPPDAKPYEAIELGTGRRVRL
jgi:hypothetical protein